MVIAIILVVLMTVLCVVDVVVNKLNPTPKMLDKGEENAFSRTICKTRKMYEYILK